jgi:sugar phosphate isomerase/epimerase
VIKPHVHVPYDTIGDHLSFIRKKQINLEIYFSSQVLDRIDPGSLNALLSQLDYGPSLTIHAPFMDLSPAAVDSKIREITIFRFHQVMDVSDVIKPRCIVFHSGYEKWKYALNVEIWLEKSLETWEEMIGRAAAIGTRIAVENIFEDTPDNLRMLAERMNSQYFGLCFDTGHFNLFSAVSLEEWIHQISPHVIELHLHDNDKTRDAHLSIGRGSFDFKTLFRLLGERNDIIPTIEAHSAPDVIESLSLLRSIDNSNIF